jgi:hypothetical protein
MPKKSKSLDLSTFVSVYSRDESGPTILSAMAGHAVIVAIESKRAHAFAALRAGLIGQVAKEVVPHGGFEAWREQIGKSVTVTLLSADPEALKTRLCRYMRVAATFIAVTPQKPAGSDWLQTGSIGSPIDSLRDAADAWIAGRSLTTIYRDCGILREKDAHQQHTDSTATPEELLRQEQMELFELWDRFRSRLILEGQETATWVRLPNEKRLEIIDATVPLVEAIATQTTWNRREAEAIRQRLIGITAALTEQLKGGQV